MMKRRSVWQGKVDVLWSTLLSGRFRSLLSEHMSAALKKFFARPAVVVGSGGLVGGTLSYHLTFGEAVIVFILIYSLFYCVQRFFGVPGALRRPVILIVLSFSVGMYCLGYISWQRSKAERSLTEIYEDGASEAGSGEAIRFSDTSGVPDARVYGNFEGTLVTVSLPEDKYRMFTLLTDDHVKVIFGSRRTDLLYGQRISVTGYLSRVQSARNPGAFDSRSFYERQGIYLSIATYDNCIRITDPDYRSPDLFVRMEVAGISMRENILHLWKQVLPADLAALLSGMILGDTSDMDADLKLCFRMCNLSHLTAVSGANVAYFLVPVTAFVQRMSGKRGIRYLCIFLFLVFFGFLTGWTASVTRALFMSAGTVVSSLLMKRADRISSLFLTAGILMLNNPYITVDFGFLLSFSATLSLLLFSGSMAGLLSKRLPKLLAEASGCLICAQLGMLPWLIGLSGKQSVLLFLINLAGTFLAEGISLLCLPLTLLLAFAQPASFMLPVVKALFTPLAGLLYILKELAINGSDQSVRALRLYDVEPVLLISVSVIALLTLFPRSFLTRNLKKVSVFLAAAGIVLQIQVLMNQPDCTVVFADVGQGDSALILLNNGKSVLIDGGDTGTGENVLIPLLNYYGIDEPDITILTHLHKDHGSGITELIASDRISDVYVPCIAARGELSELFSLSDENRVILHSIRKDDRIVLSDTAVLKILSPDVITENGGNEDSLVVLLQVGTHKILLMGDAGFRTEEYILSDDTDMSCLAGGADVIKIGHHGSKYSSSELFLTGIDASAAVISVGRNGYGHPAEDTLDRLQSSGTDVFRTDRSGAVIVNITEDRVAIYEFSA